jgi:hypothetical protein
MMAEAQRIWSAVEAEAERRAIECQWGVGEWEAFVGGVISDLAIIGRAGPDPILRPAPAAPTPPEETET